MIQESTPAVMALRCIRAKHGCNPTILNSGMTTFATRLRAVRTVAGLTQEQLALACGFNGQSRVANYESGKSAREPSIADLNLLAKALEVPVGVLVDPAEFDTWQRQPEAMRRAAAAVTYRYLHADESGQRMISAVAEAACAEYARKGP